MYLQSVRIEDLRCLRQVQLSPSPRQNLFVGDNGSGKTSLLEALYLLGRGQSFRISDSRRLIQDGCDACLVRAQLELAPGHRLALAIQKSTQGTRLKIGQDSSARLSDLARHCPVLVMEPGQHRLLEDGPVLRRRFLDWSVFHVEHGYHAIWQRFSRALKQRNALLRNRQFSQLDAWTQELLQAAEQLDRYRQAVHQQLLPHIENLLARFLGANHGIEVSYRRGWPADHELNDVLRSKLASDKERGFTQMGPHRAEIRIRVHGHLARDTLSRGQQKVLITAMLLGQAEHFAAERQCHPILLVDDLASELGEQAREHLFNCLLNYPGQSFVTALQLDLLPRHLQESFAMFHVKHGAVAPAS